MYNSIEVEIKKWGNSLGLRISKPLAEFLKIKEGSKVILTLKENRVELRAIDDEGVFIGPEVLLEEGEEGPEEKVVSPDLKSERRKRRRKAATRRKERFYRLEGINLLKMPSFDTPDYDKRFKGRTTPITLRDGNLTKVIERYPFVVVVFWDFLYLDFYESIKRKVNYMKKLAELFSGHCWFVIVNVDSYPGLRKQFIGNAWSELELLGFVNGRKVFEGYTTLNLVPVIQAISGHYLKKKEIEELDEILKIPDLRSINTEQDLLRILSEHDELVICFRQPHDRATTSKLGKVLGKLECKPLVVNSYDFAYFNEKTESFEENPLGKKFKVTRFPSILLLKKRKGEDDEVFVVEEKMLDGKLGITKLTDTMDRFFGKKREDPKEKK